MHGDCLSGWPIARRCVVARDLFGNQFVLLQLEIASTVLVRPRSWLIEVLQVNKAILWFTTRRRHLRHRHGNLIS